MPYINKDERDLLDNCIRTMIYSITNSNKTLDNPNDFTNYLGSINYCFTKVICGIMGQTNYSKIAMATGVLENIKQEFYRRLASPYEDKKISENGDIKEYE